MEAETIADILQGKDINSEDAIVTLSDRIWEIGSLAEIKRQVSDDVFTFHIVANVIGNYKCDGWQYIIEEHPDLLPFISNAMSEMGIREIGEYTKDLSHIFPIPIDVLSLSGEDYCEVVNFLHGTRIGKFFSLTIDELKQYSPEERIVLVGKYEQAIEQLDKASKQWNYETSDNNGWGVVSRYLEKHLHSKFWE